MSKRVLLCIVATALALFVATARAPSMYGDSEHPFSWSEAIGAPIKRWGWIWRFHDDGLTEWMPAPTIADPGKPVQHSDELLPISHYERIHRPAYIGQIALVLILGGLLTLTVSTRARRREAANS